MVQRIKDFWDNHVRIVCFILGVIILQASVLLTQPPEWFRLFVASLSLFIMSGITFNKSR